VTIPQKKWLLAAVVLLAAAGGCFFSWQPAEPEYAGRRVSYWLKEYCRSGQRMTWDVSRRKEATAALCQMGTNAVPCLLKQAFDIGLSAGGRRDLCRLLNLLRAWCGLPALVDPDIMSAEAADALKEIKPPANQLLPLLERHLRSTDHMERRTAVYLLGSMGDGAEQAVPWLCAALKRPDYWDRVMAAQSLGWLGPNARTAVPALIEVLKAPVDTNQPPMHPARAAALALGEIGSAAAPALPLVQTLFEQETNWNERCTLAVALCHIDGGQNKAFAYLTNGLATHQPASDRWIAAWDLGNLGPNAKAAVPLLLAALDGTNDMLFAQIPGALKKIGVPMETFLPRMKQQLRSANETTRVNAAARVSELDPANHEALQILIDEIKRRALFRDFAIEALAQAGPPAAEAVPVLRDVVQHGSKQEREVARRALRRIAPTHGRAGTLPP
jgi:HEAT repeat protein